MTIPISEHRISSIEDLQEAVAGSSLQIDQLTREPVVGTKLFSDLGGAALSCGTFSGDISATGPLSDYDVSFAILLSEEGGCRQWYREVEADDFGIFPAGIEQQAIYQAGAAYSVLTVSEEQIARFIERERLDVDLRLLESARITKHKQLGEMLRQVLPSLRASRPGKPDSVFGNEMLDRLLFCILERLGNTEHDDSSWLPHLRRPEQIVRDGIAYIRRTNDRPVTVHELSVELDIPRRSLVRAFVSVTSQSPASFIRAHRLNGVRRMLQDRSGRSQQTVSETATLWGFMHLSRFSQQYRELFGESPSTTLRKSQNVHL